jgi:hypothetical protein
MWKSCMHLTVLLLCCVATSAQAASVFTTASIAKQTITSPLVGGSINLSASGRQTFTVDPIGGTANVVSDLRGTDFVTAFGTFAYKLYNTQTVGTITNLAGGLYEVKFSVLFELKIDGGPLDGVVFETLQDSTFQATVSGFPFPVGSVLGDPNRPNDVVGVFLKSDPNSVLANFGVNIGDPVGTSSDRTVTTYGVVPEPTVFVSCVMGMSLLGAIGRKKRLRRQAV